MVGKRRENNESLKIDDRLQQLKNIKARDRSELEKKELGTLRRAASRSKMCAITKENVRRSDRIKKNLDEMSIKEFLAI